MRVATPGRLSCLGQALARGWPQQLRHGELGWPRDMLLTAVHAVQPVAPYSAAALGAGPAAAHGGVLALTAAGAATAQLGFGRQAAAGLLWQACRTFSDDASKAAALRRLAAARTRRELRAASAPMSAADKGVLAPPADGAEQEQPAVATGDAVVPIEQRASEAQVWSREGPCRGRGVVLARAAYS